MWYEGRGGELVSPMRQVWRWLPRVVRLSLPLVAAELLVMSLFRLAFWKVFSNPADPVPTGELVRAFHVGARFDLRLAVLVCLPLLMLGGFGWFDPWRRRWAAVAWQAHFAFWTLVVVLTQFIDLGHYGYLEARLNAAALQYIEDPKVSGRMMWESYPVVWGLLGLLLVVASAWFGVRALLRHPAFATPSTLLGWRRRVTAVLCGVAVVGGIYGKLSYYPLRWSDAYFSSNAFVSALALNPLLLFADTLGHRGESFDLGRVRASYPLVADYLGVDHPDAEKLDYTRTETPAGMVGGRRPNVVVILVESLATYKVSCFGNPMHGTPAFDALARDGILFRRFFVPAHGTARSVFTLVTGVPDVEVNETSSRNPLAVKQHTIINAFEGYEKLYFLGGSATWGNVRGLLSGNIAGLRLFEEGSYEAPRVDVWGISDLSLFEAANYTLREVGDRPFFAVIHTSGHHRPYTIPDDNRGFETVQADESELRRAGFVSLPEFNAFRFLDHSLGWFFEQARKEAYFGNTVFVLLGDHGLPGSAAHLPYGTAELALVRFQVPLLVYAPGLLAPRSVDTVASEVDVLPTVAGVTGTPYRNTTLGRDLLDPRFDDRRYAFTMTDQFRVPEIGLLGDRFYLRMPRGGGTPTLHDLQSTNPVADVAGTHPGETASMQALCRGLFETARYMLVHNKPAPPPAQGTGVRGLATEAGS